MGELGHFVRTWGTYTPSLRFGTVKALGLVLGQAGGRAVLRNGEAYLNERPA